MKKNTLKIVKFFYLTMLFILSGCGQDETGPQVGAITIEASSDVIEIGSELTFTAISQSSDDITDFVTFFVNDSPLEGNVYKAVSAGDIAIYATYGSVTSNRLTVLSIKKITNLTITSSKTTIKPTGTDAAVITATDQDDTDVTTLMKFYIDDVLNENGNSITSETLGESVVTAKFENLVSNELSITSELNVTALTLNLSRTSLPADSYTKSEISVFDQDLDDISSFAGLLLNDVTFSESVFVGSVPGTFQIKATYESIESDVVEITVNPFIVRKILIEEFTGEWCGWCPQAAYNLDELVKEHPYVLTVGIHNGDGLEYENEATIRNAFGLNYFPSGLVGRVNMGNSVGFNDPTLDSRVLDEVSRQIYESDVLAGVGINSSFSSNEASVDVNVHFYEDINDEVKITIYLIENDVVSGTQQNYFSGLAGYEDAYYYSQPPTISGYNHQYVLRKAATDVQGEPIPQENVSQGGTYSLNDQPIDISGYDPAKCYVIAFVHYDLNGKQEIINAQQVKLGESVGTGN
ncbi:MAG: Omp28-related outer membrane protein [Cyclobacteriaceae bacterium]